MSKKHQFFNIHSYRICVIAKPTWFNAREFASAAVEAVRCKGGRPVLVLIQDNDFMFRYMFSTDAPKIITSEYKHMHHLPAGVRYAPVPIGSVVEYGCFMEIPKLISQVPPDEKMIEAIDALRSLASRRAE